MLADIVPLLRCPGCFHSPVRWTGTAVQCVSCGAGYPLRNGILDLTPPGTAEVITPFQRIMQDPRIVAVYERFWRRAGYFIASSRSFDRELETVLGQLRGRCGGRVLDVACGPGVFTRPIAGLGEGLVAGFDLSWPMLRHAVTRATAEGAPNIVWIRGTVFRLPFISAAFPAVNCCGALHLFDNPTSALKEICRVLAPGGHLSVQTTIRPERSAGIAAFLERYIRFGFFDQTELAEMVRTAGLAVLESERHRISFTFLAVRK